MTVDQVLARLLASQPEVRGAVLATTDGRVVASALGAGLAGSAPSTAAMVAALLGIARRVVGLVGDDDLDEVVLRTASGTVVVRRVGGQLLTVLADDRLNLARLQLELRNLAPDLLAAAGAGQPVKADSAALSVDDGRIAASTLSTSGR